MELYLVQHGEAKPEAEDPARPLTERGREAVRRVAEAAARAGVQVTRIEHSGKRRAAETAEILATALRPAAGVASTPGLAPQDDPVIAARKAAALTVPTLLVGHLPHLSRLTALLVVQDPEREIVAFRMGGMVCLTSAAEHWRVGWILTPELVPPRG